MCIGRHQSFAGISPIASPPFHIGPDVKLPTPRFRYDLDVPSSTPKTHTDRSFVLVHKPDNFRPFLVQPKQKPSATTTTSTGVMKRKSPDREDAPCSSKKTCLEKSVLSSPSSSSSAESVATGGTVTESDTDETDAHHDLNTSIIPSRECLLLPTSLYMKGTYVIIRNPVKPKKLHAAWIRRVPNYPKDPFYYISVPRTDHTIASSYYKVQHKDIIMDYATLLKLSTNARLATPDYQLVLQQFERLANAEWVVRKWESSGKKINNWNGNEKLN